MEGAIDPEAFDAIVVGTGLPESILAAAAASSDLKVLHIDAEDYYGNQWASVSPDQLEDRMKVAADVPLPPASQQIDELGLVEIPIQKVRPLDGQVHKTEAELGSIRSFNLDVAGPKLAFCAGPFVDLLLKSEAYKYLEFKSIEDCFVWNGSSFVSPPTSRNEAFKMSRSLSLLGMRSLGRFLKSAEAYFSEDPQDEVFSEEELRLPIAEFLKKQGLSDELQRMLIYGLAVLDENQEESRTPVSAADALQTMALHRFSIGRFPNSRAFLYPLYGQGELTQAFCRLAALNGALYVLRRPVASVLVSKETGEYKGIRTSQGQLLYSEKLILGASYKLAENEQLTETKKLARYVCITNDSLHPNKTNILLVFPPRSISEAFTSVVRVVQLGSNASVCPRGKCVVQISTLCDTESSGKKALQAAMEVLFGAEDGNLSNIFDPDHLKPQLLWSAYSVESVPTLDKDAQLVRERIGLCSPPGPCLDYRQTVATTEKMFHRLFEGQEWFRPRAREHGTGEAHNDDDEDASKEVAPLS